LPSGEELIEVAELSGLALLEGEPVFSSGECRVWRVNLGGPFETFIADSKWGRDLAAKPEIVGEDFVSYNLRAAKGVAAFLGEILEKELPLVFLHVLRASKGYMLHEALRASGFKLAEAWIRPRYVARGYGDHTVGDVEVVAKGFGSLEALRDYGEVVLIVADTVATGNTLAKCLDEAYRELRARGLRVAQLVVYGFVSLEGLARVPHVAKRTCVVALEDYAALASNRYDMPLYGVDRAFYELWGEVRSVGGATLLEIFEKLACEYAPGMDQPGDWSERQPLLESESGLEAGNVKLHLERSLEALRSLKVITRKAPWFKQWMEEIFAEREASLLAKMGEQSGH
jgi:hypothetical protein